MRVLRFSRWIFPIRPSPRIPTLIFFNLNVLDDKAIPRELIFSEGFKLQKKHRRLHQEEDKFIRGSTCYPLVLEPIRQFPN